MYILGIESSCDETGIAIYSQEHGLLSHKIHSQIDIHSQYGGVVPEIASRDHIKYLMPLIDAALCDAGIELDLLTGIAYTAGPGLIGALLTGATFAKSLAFALGIKAIAVHHLEAHILAAKLENPTLQFPFLVLLVSGGHTQIISAKAIGDYEILGETVDDAVGEAFDKTAKLMGIPYPGGPKLAKLADECAKTYIKTLKTFPRPMLKSKDLNFSFSGLKTHALQEWQKSSKDDETKRHIAYEFQEAVVETLVKKCQKAYEVTDTNKLVVAGGVGANQRLRHEMVKTFEKVKGAVYFPALEFCTDNGAMVAYAGFLHMQQGEQDTDLKVIVKPRWPLS